MSVTARVEPARTPRFHPDSPLRRSLLLIAALTALVLVLSSSNQLYDTNYYALWEAAALRAGDHPYRDFYEWGAPLTAVLSTLAQAAVGYRLIGEFGLQWLLIIAGQVLSFYLGLRVSRSRTAWLVALFLSLVILVGTPSYSYPKLLMYPLALWLAWRYLDRPSGGRAALLGVATTVAFLLRHDHGVHVAAAAALAIALARIVRPSSRSLRSFFVEGASAAATAAATVAPWLVIVHLNEGLPQYVRQRAALYQNWSIKESPFSSLQSLNPAHALPSWDGLQHLASPLPTEENAVLWLYHITLLVPILLLASAAMDVLRSCYREESLDANTWRIFLTAGLLLLVDDQVLRQPSYFVAVAPLTAAIGARLLVWDSWTVGGTLLPSRFARLGAMRTGIRAALVAGIVLLTFVASVAFTRITVHPVDLIRNVRPTFEQLVASPPIEAVVPRELLPILTREKWDRGELDKGLVMLRYLHDCTAPGDRLLVTGSTPSHVNYLAERPFAGGHILWHHGWRSDAEHELQSLTQIQHQSVPFAFSTTDPVLDDLKRYPQVREYFLRHYVELEGSGGMLLIDTRRKPNGTFAALGFPCFR